MSNKRNPIAELLDSAISIETADADPVSQVVAARLDHASRRYRRIPDDVAPPDGLVIVGIGWEPQLRPLANPTANVSWTELRNHDVRTGSNGKGPFAVLEAFALAHELASRFDAEVVVSIPSVTQWRDAWGTLVEHDE